ESREIIQMYKEPPGDVGPLKLMITRIEEKREDLRQKRRDLEETLAELDQAEESCVERLAELGVNTGDDFRRLLLPLGRQPCHAQPFDELLAIQIALV